MTFFPGQKVVCVDVSPMRMPRCPADSPVVPIPNLLLALRVGAVYTVRDFDDRFSEANGGPTLRLEEIQGPVVLWKPVGEWEIGFGLDRFRAIQATNIDLFRRMLEPTDARLTRRSCSS